jgi:hypothetical protein
MSSEYNADPIPTAAQNSVGVRKLATDNWQPATAFHAMLRKT